jgi:hypothetical protein
VTVNPTHIARLLDAIPLVASVADRDERFPAPDLYQRVQRRDTGCIQHWTGAEWADLLCPGTGGTGDVTSEELQAVVDDLTALETRVTALEDAGPGDSSCPVYCGTGSPEAVVAAAVGSLYYQRDAVSTTHPQWVKRTGTGNTGWRAYAGHRGTSGTASLEIGDGATVTANWAVGIGIDAVASGASAVALGETPSVTAANGIAIGAAPSVTAATSIAIGKQAQAEATSAIAIGQLAHVKTGGVESIAIGRQAQTNGDHSVAMGYVCDGRQFSDIAIGYSCIADGQEAIAIGCAAQSFGVGTIAIGRVARCNAGALNSIVIGNGANTAATYAVAIGRAATATTTGQIMLGSATYPYAALHFNGNATAALTVNADGSLATVKLLGTAIADLAGGATLSDVITTVNTLLARLRTLGILAT